MNAQPDATPSQSADDARNAIVDEFGFFGDWTERYQYLIDLGRKLPPFPDALKTDENKVHEFTVGANYYFKGHNAKFTADVTYLPNGTPVADTGADILASDGEREFVFRAQFQLLL